MDEWLCNPDDLYANPNANVPKKEKPSTFEVKVAVFKYDLGYSQREDATACSAADLRALINADIGDPYSIHLFKNCMVYANKNTYTSVGRMTANTKDMHDNMFFWGGTFVVCKIIDDFPVDIDDETVEKALSLINFKFKSDMTEKEISELQEYEEEMREVFENVLTADEKSKEGIKIGSEADEEDELVEGREMLSDDVYGAEFEEVNREDGEDLDEN